MLMEERMGPEARTRLESKSSCFLEKSRKEEAHLWSQSKKGDPRSRLLGGKPAAVKGSCPLESEGMGWSQPKAAGICSPLPGQAKNQVQEPSTTLWGTCPGNHSGPPGLRSHLDTRFSRV